MPNSTVEQPHAASRVRRRWKPSALTIAITAVALIALTTALYPMTASWLSAVNQAQVIDGYERKLQDGKPSPEEQLKLAEQYNAALNAGVDLLANTNVPVGTVAENSSGLDYNRMLSLDAAGLMGRVKIPAIDVDLPIYHGTSDATLLKGAGHLEGSHLPVGGSSTRSVITAHRGLADATMFTDLNKVVRGDRITLEVFGRTLSYRVTSIEVIDPEDTGSLRPVPGKDLVTLVTCTPLGINTQRILVTGERITPTPQADLEQAGKPADAGFPCWAPLALAGVALAGTYLWRQGLSDGARAPRHDPTPNDPQPAQEAPHDDQH